MKLKDLIDYLLHGAIGLVAAYIARQTPGDPTLGNALGAVVLGVTGLGAHRMQVSKAQAVQTAREIAAEVERAALAAVSAGAIRALKHVADSGMPVAVKAAPRPPAAPRPAVGP